ncbi:MAG: endonuclease, partial [Cypionkella sp.]|nr:endonuclease [Cypionkella sp.]
MIYAATTALATLSQAERDAIAALPREVAAHDAHMAALPCMTTVEAGGSAASAPLGFPCPVAAWNWERCL